MGKAAEVDDRLTRALLETGLTVTPMARGRGTVSHESGGRCRRQSLLLRDVPIPFRQLVVLYRDLWQQTGLRVQERTEPLGLRAYDAEGYEFLLEEGPGYFGDAVLQVSSPPCGSRVRVVLLVAAGVLLTVAVTLLFTHSLL
ncbi:MAG: hypothetical protein ABW000_21940 [Actinoplanes sp.]